MVKNNRKKAVAQAISTAVALGWVIMQVESAQAATLTVNNSTISSKNNIEINASRVSFNDHSNLVGGDITITAADSIEVINPGTQVTIPISTVKGNSGQISSGSKNLGAGGDITITTSRLTVRPGAFISKPVTEPSAIAASSNHSGAGSNITLTIPNLIILKPVRKPSAIAAGSNNSGAGGNISIKAGFLLLKNATFIPKSVPEPSAIASSILAVSLAWLAKRKQAAFRKAKV
ncbi:MAG: hypothetical protein V7L25_00410 [Nostoc sp.]|uniref:hypothetical protein n=1 Tax=Nostoc sp. TaxID=1180 RepID=UPI002FF21AF5